MRRLVYNILLYLMAPFIWAYFIFRAVKAVEYRDGYWQRLGILPRTIKGHGILVHCASVGESRAAAPLIERLLTAYPERVITISTTTPTGKQTIHSLFADAIKNGQLEHVYLPIDWPGSVRRFLARLQPQLVILMETELWLNLLAECNNRRIPVMLANARLSDKSLAKYLKHAALARLLFSYVHKIAAQYESDRINFLQLGVANQQIQRVGSIKFDLQISSALQAAQQSLKKRWTVNRPVWIAASIHPAEFDWILNAHQQLLIKQPDLLLIGVPRHPEKFAEFKSACEKQKLRYVCRSEESVPTIDTQVVVGDTLGEMLLFCGVADVAYVGGSLIERGGHNPLEPLVCGLPVIMGPHFYNFADICQLLIDQSLLEVVRNESELVATVADLLSDRQHRQQQSLRALNFMAENRGCVERLVQLSADLLDTAVAQEKATESR